MVRGPCTARMRSYCRTCCRVILQEQLRSCREERWCPLWQALLEALGAGAASDLIELDMRGNPFTPEHLRNLVRLPLLFTFVSQHVPCTVRGVATPCMARHPGMRLSGADRSGCLKALGLLAGMRRRTCGAAASSSRCWQARCAGPPTSLSRPLRCRHALWGPHLQASQQALPGSTACKRALISWRDRTDTHWTCSACCHRHE
jgi:hypothetical protein